MISIDFVAGSHGNFLEFVCNKFIAGVQADFTPFNSLGASHLKSPDYEENKVFSARHYSELNLPMLSNKVVRITFNHDDLLLLSSGALLRAGNAGLENNELEINTYDKLLGSKYYAYLIDKINNAYPDFKISQESPNCPRYVLREFFKFGFKNPEEHGFTEELKKLQYTDQVDCIDFSYSSFYNYTLFLENINLIACWYGTPLKKIDELKSVWDDFIDRQIYKNHKYQCDIIIDDVLKLVQKKIPPLSLFQESYINGILEKKFEIEMPFIQYEYFKYTNEISQHLCLK